MKVQLAEGDLVKMQALPGRWRYGRVLRATEVSVRVDWEHGQTGTLFYERGATANAHMLVPVGRNELAQDPDDE